MSGLLFEELEVSTRGSKAITRGFRSADEPNLAVTEHLDLAGRWAISHLPSGRAVLTFDTPIRLSRLFGVLDRLVEMTREQVDWSRSYEELHEQFLADPDLMWSIQSLYLGSRR